MSPSIESLDIRTSCSPFPVPLAMKWEATDESTGTVGNGATREAAIEKLLEQLGMKLPLYRVRIRAFGAHRYHYIDIEAATAEAATRAVMDQYKSCSEAYCIGSSPAGARNGDCI